MRTLEHSRKAGGIPIGNQRFRGRSPPLPFAQGHRPAATDSRPRGSPPPNGRHPHSELLRRAHHFDLLHHFGPAPQPGLSAVAGLEQLAQRLAPRPPHLFEGRLIEAPESTVHSEGSVPHIDPTEGTAPWEANSSQSGKVPGGYLGYGGGGLLSKEGGLGGVGPAPTRPPSSGAEFQRRRRSKEKTFSLAKGEENLAQSFKVVVAVVGWGTPPLPPSGAELLKRAPGERVYRNI